MLKPKKLKYRKYQKSNVKSCCVQHLEPKFFGLKSLESGRISARQIESVRRVVRRKLNRQGDFVIDIFPDLPVTKKPTEVRMGKGKGSVDGWVSRIKKGRILFRISKVPEDKARFALKLGSYKLPITTRFVRSK
jgi:large subunit ribosomal protein L16